MKEDDIIKTELKSLARMMDLQFGDSQLWAPDELAAILQHQLDAPLEFDFTRLGNVPTGTVAALSPAEGPPIETFRDLFAHPNPPVELLEQTKQFAKKCRSRCDGPLPDEIATIVYFLSIVSAMTRCNRRISRLDDQSLRYALDWATSQAWVDESTREILRRGHNAIDPK